MHGDAHPKKEEKTVFGTKRRHGKKRRRARKNAMLLRYSSGSNQGIKRNIEIQNPATAVELERLSQYNAKFL
ncbi:MAG: hypothetical protein ACI4VB_06355 [Bradymonadia bacterium]